MARKKAKAHEAAAESREEKHEYKAPKGKRGGGDTGEPETGQISGGPVFHAGMVAYPDGLGGHDEHAHHTHHEANSAYEMPEGTSPKGYGSDDEGGSSHGGEGMADNAEYC